MEILWSKYIFLVYHILALLMVSAHLTEAASISALSFGTRPFERRSFEYGVICTQRWLGTRTENNGRTQTAAPSYIDFRYYIGQHRLLLMLKLFVSN